MKSIWWNKCDGGKRVSLTGTSQGPPIHSFDWSSHKPPVPLSPIRTEGTSGFVRVVYLGEFIRREEKRRRVTPVSWRHVRRGEKGI